jgi:probable phosphoglycerate mutase
MSKVWFIRHGQCTANIGEATRSPAEAKLTEQGWQEAYAIAKYLSPMLEHESIRIFTSPYIRAQQTAQATLELCGIKRIETLPVQEFNYLALYYTIPTTAAQRSSLVRNYWEQCRPRDRYDHNTESFIDFIARIQRVLKTLQHTQHAEDELKVVFSHHLFMQGVRWLSIRNIRTHAKHLQPSNMKDFHTFVKHHPIPTGAIIKATYNQRGYHLRSKIEIETIHLSNAVTR